RPADRRRHDGAGTAHPHRRRGRTGIRAFAHLGGVGRVRSPMKQITVLLRRLLPYLPESARRFLLWYSIVAALLSIVDVLALMLLALTLASAATGSAISLPIVGALPESALIWMIVGLSALVIAKSAANVGLQW